MTNSFSVGFCHVDTIHFIVQKILGKGAFGSIRGC